MLTTFAAERSFGSKQCIKLQIFGGLSLLHGSLIVKSRKGVLSVLKLVLYKGSILICL